LSGPLEGTTAGQFESRFRTCVFGAAAMIRHTLPHMRPRRSGVIVKVSSVAGLAPTPFLSACTASKYALEGLSESLRFELEPQGIE
jgi:NAD(P)-dependent dehydrogenase (short-subunit alcohol dehydrogenase family)